MNKVYSIDDLTFALSVPDYYYIAFGEDKEDIEIKEYNDDVSIAYSNTTDRKFTYLKDGINVLEVVAVVVKYASTLTPLEIYTKILKEFR